MELQDKICCDRSGDKIINFCKKLFTKFAFINCTLIITPNDLCLAQQTLKLSKIKAIDILIGISSS